MISFRAALAAIVMLAAILSAGAEERSVPDAQFVRLKHRAIGCGSVESMVRVAAVYVTKGPDVAQAVIPAEGCQMFETFSGQITDRTPGGLCVLGLVRSRCLWFPTAAYASGSLKQGRPALLAPTHPG
jgi:hypothetical protein